MSVPVCLAISKAVKLVGAKVSANLADVMRALPRRLAANLSSRCEYELVRCSNALTVARDNQSISCGRDRKGNDS
jgi:hypothetical protein